MAETPTGLLQYVHMNSPVGTLQLVGDTHYLRHIFFPAHAPQPAPSWQSVDSLPYPAAEQLTDYFAGTRTEFDLPLSPEGTTFQLEVWAALEEIPFGETISYMELARRVGNPDAVRAASLANGKNPLPIVVPCHRVVGSDGSMTGYSGGLSTKEFLLTHEGVPVPERMQQLSLF
ncbi:MAG: methylated-DNA--[protein]-cysteine S-methyltransferase [Candidatus Latescibacterota bacterium]|nr:methylated-DNA--[protein]-cysteine S-methyltransferase [Candidatus Latescibacterota bacterium]